MSTRKLNLYLEMFYDLDEDMRRELQFQLANNDDIDNSVIITGSLLEGAFLTPLMIPVKDKSFDIDLMRIMGQLSKDQANTILVETEYPGYYLIDVLDDQLGKEVEDISCLYCFSSVSSCLKL